MSSDWQESVLDALGGAKVALLAIGGMTSAQIAKFKDWFPEVSDWTTVLTVGISIVLVIIQLIRLWLFWRKSNLENRIMKMDIAERIKEAENSPGRRLSDKKLNQDR